MRASLLLSALLLALAGCASRPHSSALIQSPEQRCEHLYEALDDAAWRSDRIDAGSVRMPRHRYLRTDRFTASLADRASDGAAWDAWILRMSELDASARSYEWANLPAGERDRLTAMFPELSERVSVPLESCAKLLSQRDFQDPARRSQLRKYRVPDDYDGWKRAVGIYALTRIAFASGVRKYQAQTTDVFARDLGQLPVHGELVAYAPRASPRASHAELRELMASSRDDPLGIPVIEPRALQRMFDAFAPIYWIDTVDDNDRIGTVELDSKRATVNTEHPIVYQRLAYTRYGVQIWPQLIYSVWFPSRPRTGAFDTLGGHLDGLTWRVTLDRDGVPMLYDSIHNCGCYHQFFVTEHMAARAQPDTLDEIAFVPQRIAQPKAEERIWLRIATRTHYLERILLEPRPDKALYYDSAADDVLRSMPLPDASRRSLFRADGIVSGSERGERWFFWPMGVREPGAMREWGHHATAFVGRRHFDDADLIERYFELIR